MTDETQIIQKFYLLETLFCKFCKVLYVLYDLVNDIRDSIRVLELVHQDLHLLQATREDC